MPRDELVDDTDREYPSWLMVLVGFTMLHYIVAVVAVVWLTLNGGL